MKILIIAEDQSDRDRLELHLQGWGDDILAATNNRHAHELLYSQPVDVIISDGQIPDLHNGRPNHAGGERFAYLLVIGTEYMRPEIQVGLQNGIDDYLIEPFEADELHTRIRIGRRIVALKKQLAVKPNDLTVNHRHAIDLFDHMLDTFDTAVAGHCRRVSKLALELALRHPGMNPYDCQIIETAGLLHDIGMLVLPEQVRRKKRNERIGNEQEIYQSHPALGEAMVNKIATLRPVAKFVRMHHEQPNGRGFPDGLTGDVIPLTAQIIAAASIYDNMVHRGHEPLEAIPERLDQMRDYLIGSPIVDLLLAYNRENLEAETDANMVTVDLENLTGAMTLARNVIKNNGAVLLPAETPVDYHVLERLKQYQQLNLINDKVTVYKESLYEEPVRG